MKYAICDMNGPIGYFTTWNKSHRERQILYDHLYVASKKTNEQM